MGNGSHPHIGWVDDPTTLAGLIETKPDRELQPLVIGEYDAKPKGAVRADLRESAVWCCECQGRTHWRGYVVTDVSGGLYLIGSRCGKLFYGGDRFVMARRTYHDQQKRIGLLERRAQLVKCKTELQAELAAAANGAELRAIEQKRAELKAAHPDMMLRLANFAASGNALTEMVRVRGAKGMEVRPMGLGRLEGGGLVHSSLRGRIADVHRALEALAEFDTASDESAGSTRELEKMVQAAERSAVEALEQWRILAQSGRFFHDDQCTPDRSMVSIASPIFYDPTGGRRGHRRASGRS